MNRDVILGKRNDIMKRFVEEVAEWYDFGSVDAAISEWISESTEWDHRARDFAQIQKLLSTEPLDFVSLRKVCLGSTVLKGHRSFSSKLTKFFGDKKAQDAVEQLLGSPRRPPGAREIDNFIDRVQRLGFANKGDKPGPNRGAAASLASVLLTSAFPKAFVQFKVITWKWFTEALGLDRPDSLRRKQVPYGELITWAGHAVQEIADIPAVRSHFCRQGIHDSWSVAGLLWMLSREYDSEDGGKSKYREIIERIAGDVVEVEEEYDTGGDAMIYEITDLLDQFHQVVLYGPPGTGKTRLARQTACWILAGTPDDYEYPESTDDVNGRLAKFETKGRFKQVVFHPAYEYDQFVGGITASTLDGHVAYMTEAGPFLKLCKQAAESDETVVLIIDEINRGNLPKLLGELVFALEYRGASVTLPFNLSEKGARRELMIPSNLKIIGTMNSADRSIGQIDVAIRRRFAFVPMKMNPDVITSVWSDYDESFGGQLASLARVLNALLRNSQSEDLANGEIGVGHSYFLPDEDEEDVDLAKEQVKRKWTYQVLPLLREYQLLSPDLDMRRYEGLTLAQALDSAPLHNGDDGEVQE